MSKRLLGFLFVLGIILYVFRANLTRQFYEPTPAHTPPAERENPQLVYEVVAEDLQVPWEIAFLPDAEMLVTERPGTLKRIGKTTTTISIPGVKQTSEGGLLGLALHPNFAENHFLYLYLTTSQGTGSVNRVERYRLENDQLQDRLAIINNIPGAPNHDGGRIAFGPDGHLYITTGDAQNADFAQDENSLAGKILRLKDDGSIPPDNPFRNATYSWGHRNPQGIAWDRDGRLWSTEHGRSGMKSGLDEINLIEKGANYGWPVIQGDETREGMSSPVVQSGPAETWAPSGLAYWNGKLYFAGLRGESLYEAETSSEKVTKLEAHFRGQFGRLRAVVVGPDNNLYVSTSNTDGRGQVRPGDDKIIRLKYQ